MDFPRVINYDPLGWWTDMRRGCSFHTVFAVLLALQVLVPPAWVKHGLDCRRHCRLAATTGAHCPSQHNAHPVKPRHHCHEPAATPSSAVLRCHCSQSATSLASLDVPRFVVPQVVTATASPLTLRQSLDPVMRLVETFRTPPDPPPRSLLVIAL
ncbi:MAG: hypothetical protein ACRERD_21000 [Candidatus Binatia bacterium]